MSTEQSPPDTATAAPQLQLSDLILVAQIIQLMGQRGAFKAEEFSQVGALYERIVKFLQDSGALTPAESATEQAPAE